MTDSSTGGGGMDPSFDPRFDPAFQPGYDPRVHGQVSIGPSEPRLEAQPDPGRESVDRTALPVGSGADSGRADAGGTDTRGAYASSAAGPTLAETETTGSGIRRFDPYLIALWIVSAAFVASGLLVVRYIADRLDTLNATGGGGTFNYYLLQVYTIGAPLLILLGFATATGTLFVLAARRRR